MGLFIMSKILVMQLNPTFLPREIDNFDDV